MNDKSTYKLEAFDLVQLVLSKYHDHQMHGVIKLDGHINEVILKQAVLESAKDLPHILCKLKKTWNKEYWSKSNFTVEDIVKVKKSDLSQDQIMANITKATDTFNGPQLCITVLRGNTKDVLCIVMNHMLCDGAGFKSYLYLICSLYNSIIGDGKPSIRYNPDARGLDRLINKTKGKIQTKGYKVKNENFLVELEGNNNRPFIAIEKFSQEEFLLIKIYAKKEKVTINDIFMSSYISSLRNVWNLPISNMTGTVDFRKYLKDKKANGLCNLAGFITCSIDSRKALKFHDILMQVSASMKEEKESTNCLKPVTLLYSAQKYLPHNLFKKIIEKTLNNPPIAFTNIGILEKRFLEFYGVLVDEAFVTGAIKYSPNFQMAVSTFNDEATLSINLYGSENDEAKICDFLKNLKAQLMLEVT